MPPRRSLDACRLYAILDTMYLVGRDPSRVATQMITGGVDIIQLRAKGRDPEEIAEMARAVLPVTRSAGIPLIINDHPAVTANSGADGVHVGQGDLPVAEARALLGKTAWIGKSTHTFQQAIDAEKEGADYIGVGPIFATPTKADYAPVGLELIRRVAAKIGIPFFCIGGIKLENAAEVIAAGARRLVVVSGILHAPAPPSYCRALKNLLGGRG